MRERKRGEEKEKDWGVKRKSESERKVRKRDCKDRNKVSRNTCEDRMGEKQKERKEKREY